MNCKFKCLLDANWFHDVKDLQLSNFFQCGKPENENCEHCVSYGTKFFCSCPIGNYVISHRDKLFLKERKKLKVALIVSHDQEIRRRFSRLLNQVGISYIFESGKAEAIIRILQIDMNLIIVDAGSEDDDIFNFIRVIKKLKPRIQIIVITPKLTDTVYTNMLNAGAMYCLINPHKEKEFKEAFRNLFDYMREKAS